MTDAPISTASAKRALPPLLRAMRPWQWSKNILIFLPLLLGHALLDGPKVLFAVLGFIAFCLAASAGYLFNDWKDVESDRQHAEKRNRPMAAGELSLKTAMLAVVICAVVGFGLAAIISLKFLAYLALYMVLTLSYSSFLKRKPVVDLIVLAGLYTLRVLAGGAATHLPVSFWLLAFSMFIFLSLAMIKRLAELKVLESSDQTTTLGRGYRTTDLALLRSAGPASGYMAVLVMALYLNSEQVRHMYVRPDILWLVCPLLLYWVTRAWLLADRGLIHEDPIAWAMRDRVTYIVLLLVGILVVAAAV